MWDKFLEFHKRHVARHFGSTATASTMALHLVTGPFVGGLFGYFLDDWLDTKPWLFILFLILGIAAGFNNMYYDAKLLIKIQERERDDETDPPPREN